MKRLCLIVVCAALAACGGNIDSKKGDGDEGVNNANNANAQNGTSGANGEPGPVNGVANNEPAPINNKPQPNNQPQPNNEPLPVNNQPQPNNEPVPVNNDPDPPNAMTGDACNNDADLEAVTSTETPYTARDCQLECISDSAPRDCTAQCVEMFVGTSLGCSYCIADLTACGLQNCAEQCVEDPYAAVCIECLETFCDDDFIACSGIPAR